MSRYLVVANQTLGSRELMAEFEARRRGGPSTFHVLVPIMHPAGAWAEGQVQAQATQRLGYAMTAKCEAIPCADAASWSRVENLGQSWASPLHLLGEVPL